MVNKTVYNSVLQLLANFLREMWHMDTVCAYIFKHKLLSYSAVSVDSVL